MLKRLEERKNNLTNNIQEKTQKLNDLELQQKKTKEEIRKMKQKIKHIDKEIHTFKVNEIAKLLTKNNAIGTVYEELKAKEALMTANEEKLATDKKDTAELSKEEELTTDKTCTSDK